MRGLFVNDQSTDITKLRQLIGVRVRYLEDIWQVIEILEDGPTLVLESLQQRKVVVACQSLLKPQYLAA